MTTIWGSLRPLSRATRVAAGMPIAVAAAAIARVISGVAEPGKRRITANQISVAAIDPIVPGPGRNVPQPKNVPTIQAQRVRFTPGR